MADPRALSVPTSLCHRDVVRLEQGPPSSALRPWSRSARTRSPPRRRGSAFSPDRRAAMGNAAPAGRGQFSCPSPCRAWMPTAARHATPLRAERSGDGLAEPRGRPGRGDRPPGDRVAPRGACRRSDGPFRRCGGARARARGRARLGLRTRRATGGDPARRSKGSTSLRPREGTRTAGAGADPRARAETSASQRPPRRSAEEASARSTARAKVVLHTATGRRWRASPIA